MKAPSILLFASLLTLCTSQPAPAVMNEFSTTNRLIAVTNVSATSEIRPLAAYILFPTPATGTVSISRVTRGVAVPLARHSFTNILTMTWLPPADFPLRRGESFAVSSTVARFTLQLESRAEGGAVERTEATEWYTDGRPFGAQSAGGSSVVVSNSQQVIVTNNIVITNSITVNAGAGGGYIPNNATFVTTNGTLNLWDTGTSLNYGMKDGEWYSFMREATIGLRGESALLYSIGYVDDLGPTPHMTFTDPTSGTVTLADLLGGGTAQGPWTNSIDAATYALTNLQYVGFNFRNMQFFGDADANGQLGVAVWDGDNSRYAWYYGSTRADGSVFNAGDVLTVDASGRWYATAPSGGGGSSIPTLGPWATTNANNFEIQFPDDASGARLTGTTMNGDWWWTGFQIRMPGPYNAGNGFSEIGMGFYDEADLTFDLAGGARITMSNSTGSARASLHISDNDAGGLTNGASIDPDKLTLRRNAATEAVTVEVVATGEMKLTDQAARNAGGVLLQNIVRWVTAPAAATDPGTAGDAAYDGSFLYVCVATDTWLRTAIATW